jgi:hypothetical protein
METFDMIHLILDGRHYVIRRLFLPRQVEPWWRVGVVITPHSRQREYIRWLPRNGKRTTVVVNNVPKSMLSSLL